MLFSRSKKGVVGLDVGSSAIKLVELRERKGEYHLQRLGVEEESPGVAASALEFALEGLHLSRRLNKDLEARAGRSRYRSADPDA